MLITDLQGEIIILIIGRLVSLQTLRKFLKAIPSMVPLLINYFSENIKSVSQFLQKENKFLSYVNAILAAHFSGSIHTVDELESFLAYNLMLHLQQQKPCFLIAWNCELSDCYTPFYGVLLISLSILSSPQTPLASHNLPPSPSLPSIPLIHFPSPSRECLTSWPDPKVLRIRSTTIPEIIRHPGRGVDEPDARSLHAAILASIGMEMSSFPRVSLSIRSTR